MAIRSSLYFEFAGKKSIDFGIINVNMSSGMQEETFVASREINETKIRGRDRPYFHGVKSDPLKIKVSFAFEDTFDTDKIREVARWLTDQTNYQPLIFSENNERIYYAMVVGDSTLIHNCLSQGYISLEFRCSDPYSYSPEILSRIYDWNEIPYTLAETVFVGGFKENLIIEPNNYLELNPTKTKWSDYTSITKWSDLV